MCTMYRFWTLALFICAATAREPRILDGDPTSIETAPYQASLSIVDKGHICGASIISKNWILTAAHCAREKPEKYGVRVGSTFSDGGGDVHRVSKIVLHEQFKQDIIPINDVALIRVDPPINLDRRTKRPIELYDNLDVVEAGDIGLVAGWGAVKKPILKSSKHLMSVNLSVISTEECVFHYEVPNGKLPTGNFCAKHPSGRKNSCQGDSGGAFVVDGKQAGIVSWGAPWDCDEVGLPTVYVQVAQYHDWIYKRVGLPSKL